MSQRTPLDIYSAHFGLVERPFSLQPDPQFLYWSKQHRLAYTMLQYGLMTHSPITLITGEVGAGKTTLLIHMLRSVGDDVTIGLISNVHSCTRDELLRWIMQSLDEPLPKDDDFLSSFQKFTDYILAEYAAGRSVILVLDEAQNLNAETLEELRMLTNVNSNKDILLQLVLVGQPELLTMVKRPELRQFAQRVASSFHIPAMDEPSVREYIEHRLRVAGSQTMLFDDAACNLIFRASEGIPRLVNKLCDMSLVYAFSENEDRVSASIVEQVLKDGAFFGGNNSILILTSEDSVPADQDAEQTRD